MLDKRSLSLLFALALGCAPSAAPLDAEAGATHGDDDVLWEGCPAPARAPVGEGELWLQFAIDNTYCGATDLAVESVQDELARKAQLHLVPGDYFLPLTAGVHDVDLPFCSLFVDGLLAPRSSGGQLTVSRSTVLGRERAELRYQRPLTGPAGETFTFHVDIDGYLDELERGLLLDGRAWPERGASVRLYLCEGDSCDESEDVRVFEACRFEDLPEEVHRFELEGGNLSVLVEAEGSADSFRGTPRRASGELMGVPFVVEGYWDLVMRRTYWYDSARDFVVRFPRPQGSVCGLVVRSAYPYPNASWGTQVFTLGCDGELTPRTLVTVDWERLTPPDDAGAP